MLRAPCLGDSARSLAAYLSNPSCVLTHINVVGNGISVVAMRALQEAIGDKEIGIDLRLNGVPTNPAARDNLQRRR